jgi:hypothetical protein
MATGGGSKAIAASNCSGNERIERNFAHQFDTGGMDRLWVRGRQNVHKKLLIQAAACNLALLMRLRHGSGKLKAAHDRLAGLIVVFLILVAAREVSSFPHTTLP